VITNFPNWNAESVRDFARANGVPEYFCVSWLNDDDFDLSTAEQLLSSEYGLNLNAKHYCKAQDRENLKNQFEGLGFLGGKTLSYEYNKDLRRLTVGSSYFVEKDVKEVLVENDIVEVVGIIPKEQNKIFVDLKTDEILEDSMPFLLGIGSKDIDTVVQINENKECVVLSATQQREACRADIAFCGSDLDETVQRLVLREKAINGENVSIEFLPFSVPVIEGKEEMERDEIIEREIVFNSLCILANRVGKLRFMLAEMWSEVFGTIDLCSRVIHFHKDMFDSGLDVKNISRMGFNGIYDFNNCDERDSSQCANFTNSGLKTLISMYNAEDFMTDEKCVCLGCKESVTCRVTYNFCKKKPKCSIRFKNYMMMKRTFLRPILDGAPASRVIRLGSDMLFPVSGLMWNGDCVVQGQFVKIRTWLKVWFPAWRGRRAEVILFLSDQNVQAKNVTVPGLVIRDLKVLSLVFDRYPKVSFLISNKDFNNIVLLRFDSLLCTLSVWTFSQKFNLNVLRGEDFVVSNLLNDELTLLITTTVAFWPWTYIDLPGMRPLEKNPISCLFAMLERMPSIQAKFPGLLFSAIKWYNVYGKGGHLVGASIKFWHDFVSGTVCEVFTF